MGKGIDIQGDTIDVMDDDKKVGKEKHGKGEK